MHVLPNQQYMKNLCRALFLLIVLLSSCSKNNTGYVIDLDLKNLGGKPVFSVHETSDNKLVIDTLFTNGNFIRLKGDADSLSMITLYFWDKPDKLHFYVKNGDRLEVKGDLSELNKLEVSGESLNGEIYKFRSDNALLLKEIASTRLSLNTPKTNLPQTQEKLDSLQLLLRNNAIRYVTGHTGSNSGAVIFWEYLLDDHYFHENDSLLNLIRPEAQPYFIREKIKKFQFISGVCQPDSAARFFSLKNEKDTLVHIDSAFFSKKPTLIYFWAPYNAESTKLNQLLSRFNYSFNDSINWVSISLDNDTSRWKKKVKEDKLTGYQLADLKGWDANVVKLYGVPHLPYIYIVDKNGKIAGHNLYGNPLKLKMRQLLSNDSIRSKK